MDFQNQLESFIDMDSSYNPQYSIIHETIEDGIIIHDIEISTPIGRVVNAYIVKPAIEGKYPGINFIHWLETEAVDSNRNQFLPHAKELARKGFVSIMPDCFWSLDKDKFKENAKQYTDNWWKTNFEKDSEIVKNQLIELICVHKILVSLPEVDSTTKILAAHDFGAMTGSLLKSLGYGSDYYVLIAFTGRFTDWFRFGSKLPEEDPVKFEEYVHRMEFFDPINHIQHLDPSPILMQFGDDDFYVPEVKAKELYDKAGANKEIKWYQAKHGMNSQTFEDMKTWIISRKTTSNISD